MASETTRRIARLEDRVEKLEKVHAGIDTFISELAAAWHKKDELRFTEAVIALQEVLADYE